MNIAFLKKTSLNEFPGKVSCIVYTQGCNLNCVYCYNKQLIPFSEDSAVSTRELIQFLKERKGLLDGVVFTGGEPTLQLDLVDMCKEIKAFGYAIKINTNGTCPKMLKQLIDYNLVDYIQMDIKQTFEKYKSITPICPFFIEEIKQSVELIKNSKVDYHFNTTTYNSIKEEDIVKIREISGNKLSLQECINV